VRAAALVFDLLLGACPHDMRREYGVAMRAHFASTVREGGAAAAFRAYADVVLSGLGERVAMLARDVAFALRGMRRTPVFALVVILTAAVAIGANGAVYGLLANVVLRPLPIAQPDSLLALWEVDSVHGYTSEAFTYEDYEALRRDTRTLETIAVLRPVSGTLVGAGGPPLSVRGASVGGDFFAAYAARPQLGRLLGARDERDATPAVVISDELWRTRFGGDPALVGRTVRINDTARTVVGVAPPRFLFADLWRGQIDHADYFVAMAPGAARRTGHSVLVVARPTAPSGAVDADLKRIFASLAVARPDTGAGLSARAVHVTDAILGPMRPSLVAVGLAVLAVLAVACANIANLFLSRGSSRAGEIATRFALGASRRRLLTQLLTESTLHVAIGGVLGLALAAVLVHAVAGLIDAAAPVIYLQHLEPDWKTFAATGLSIVLAALLAGAAPALALTRPDLVSAMKSADRSSAGTGRRLRGALVTLEIALAIAVVAAAAIATRSYYDLARQPLGFDTANVTVAFVGGASPRRYDTAARADALLQAIRARVDATPGIASTAWALTTPFIGESQTSFRVEGAHYAPGNEPIADVDTVSDGYFGTLRIPLLAGRDFSRRDVPSGAAVAIVSRSFAERYLGGVRAAIGRQLTAEMSTLDVPVRPRTVVGVVGDMRPHVATRAAPTLYAPLAQIPNLSWVKLVVRTPLNTQQVAEAVTAAVGAADATMPRVTATSLEHERAVDALDRWLTDVMLAALAAIALSLAVAGIYAVVSYGVARRTREIGIRAAFGAGPRAIVTMVLRDALRLAAAGIVVGLVFAGLAAWALKEFLDVDAPVDALTGLTVLAIIAGSIGIAAYLPARRAARVDPVVALRYE
jgi:predicted permease